MPQNMVVRVLKSLRPACAQPAIDLATVRETLLYMKDDTRRVPDLARVTAALETAIREIEKVEPAADAARRPALAARFMPSLR